MRAYSFGRLSDDALLRTLSESLARERASTAEVLALVAEVDARRLYLPAGYPSMHAYCVGKLHLSEDAALRRIQAARTARRFPAVFEAIADGRLHLTAVCVLAPYLTRGNADALLAAAAGRTKAEIAETLARRFPSTESLPLVTAIPNGSSRPDDLSRAHAPYNSSVPGGQAADSTSNGSMIAGSYAPQHAPAHVGVCAGPADSNGRPAPQPPAAPRSKLAPIAHERYVLQLTIGRNTHEKLSHAQALLSHKLPAGDLAAVLDLALDALVEKLEKRKFAATTKPRTPRRPTTGSARDAQPRSASPSRSAGPSRSADPRHIPAHVKRAVWARDGGRCTFVGDGGHRCGARKFLEYDHVEPVACGGTATVENVRLRCRMHNQHEAERAFGADFMRAKREAAQQARDVTTCLRELGFRADQAQRATAHCMAAPEASLEARVRTALAYLCPKRARRPVEVGVCAAGGTPAETLERSTEPRDPSTCSGGGMRMLQEQCRHDGGMPMGT